MGLMAAVEFVTSKDSKEMLNAPKYINAMVSAAFEAGAIVRASGNRLILSPPLVFSRADVDETLRILHLAISAAENI
jgi:putrescine---pyruvate transaminase